MHTANAKYFNAVTQKWQEISPTIDTKLNFDYSHCTWFAIDGEFTGLYPQRDQTVLWTIASEDTEGNLRVEMLHTFGQDADISGLKELLLSDKEKLFWYGKVDIAYLYKETGVKVAQPVYDVKLASVVARTYTQDHHLNILFKIYVSTKEEIMNKREVHYRDWVTDPASWPDEIHQYNVNDVIYLKYFADKLKDVAKLAGRTHVIESVNNALPELGVIYASGFYRDIFVPGYDDRIPQR